MKKLLLALTPLLLCANNNLNEDLLLVLNEASEIATATKLNIDKTPSTVTVLKQDFIQKSGAKRLIDLLRYIPGIELSMSSSGKRQIIVRGIKGIYRDKIKLLVDGVDVTNTLYSNQFYYYSFPTSLIKRIEFTKSPNAVLYGSNAFVGVLSIYTIREGSFSFFVGNDNFSTITLSNHFHFLNGQLSFDTHLLNSNPSFLANPTLKIDLATSQYSLFREPLPAHAKEKSYGLGIKYKNDTLSITSRWQHYKKGNFFGIARVVPHVKDKFVDLDHFFIDLAYQKYLSPKHKLEFHAGWINYLWDGEYRTFPYDLQPTSDPNKDLIIGAHFHEHKIYFKGLYKYFGEKHTLTTGIEANYAHLKDSYYLQYISYLGQDPTPLRGDKNVLPKGVDRRIFSFFTQDLLQINDNISLQFGLRYDQYKNIDDYISYQGGFIYSFDKANSLKLLYNNAYRAPSWAELYAQSKTEFHGNPNLKPEKIDLTELQYIYKENFQLKLNYYFGKNRDAIIKTYGKNGEKIYKNSKGIDIRGYEISVLLPFQGHKWMMNYSHNQNKNHFQNYLGTREHLLNSYLELNFGSFTSFTALNWGSEIKLLHAHNIPNCFRIDEVFSYHKNNIEFQFGIYNITNSKNYYLITPSDRIQNRYYFVPAQARALACGREYFIRMIKKW